MDRDWRDDVIRHSRKLLARWDGANARLVEVTLSVQTLQLLLTQPNREGNLRIGCAGPVSIQMDTEFVARDLRIEKHSDPRFLVLTDVDGSLRIVCEGTIWCRENVKKL
jgi:hypothetical protein